MKDKKLEHLAIIMDGNGRWATKRGLPRSKGHDAGYKALKKICKYIAKSEIKVLSVFAFSTENFKRSKEEVDHLMNMFIKAFKKEKDFFLKQNIKVLFSGTKENLRDDVINAMQEIEELTSSSTGGIFNICLNYGGRKEIVDAVNNIIDSNVSKINEEDFSKYLYNDLPDIDLMIRTSGEMRISNFMLWQLSYAEIYFTDVLFPDFNEEELEKAIDYYYKRDRRFGGINYK